jgi:GTP-binding protein
MNIVIVGRPNVGKSSLFNRLLGRRRSLVLDTPGVTRDRIVEPATFWVAAKEYNFNLIDTGGLGPGQFEDEIRLQVQTALTEAKVILFVMDIRAGLTSGDREVWSELRRSGATDNIPVIGVLNKADSDSFDDMMSDFYALGMDHLVTVSAEHTHGIDDLKDMIVAMTFEKDKDYSVVEEDEDAIDEYGHNKKQDEEDAITYAKMQAGIEDDVEVDKYAEEVVNEAEELKPRIPKIAIIGQPNVGKSTMLNAICGEKRTIVSPIAGTTVDSIDLNIKWHGRDFTLIDTAGIRRKDKTEQGVEVLSVVQSRKTLERADLTFFMIDGEKGVYDQDEKIAGLIEESGSSVIIILNKWDTQADNVEFSQKKAEEELRKKIRFLGYVPILFTTATESIGLDRLYRVAIQILENRRVRLHTRELTEFMREETEVHNPHNAKFYYVHQSGRNPPTFVAHVNDPKKIDFSLSRHLVKSIRRRWGYEGTPIRLHFLKTKNSGEK